MLLALPTQQYFALNPVAAEIWECLSHGTTPAAIIDRLSEKYNVSREQVTADDRTVTTDPSSGYFGAQLNDTALIATPGANAWIAPTSYEDWLREHA